MLEKWCPDYLFDAIAGDLIEQFHENEDNKGTTYAKLYFYFSTLKFFRPSLLFRNKFRWGFFRNTLLIPNLTLFYRKFMRNKVYGSINIIGLSISLALVLLIFLFVKHEFSYNRFHEKGDMIFQLVNTTTLGPNKGEKSAIVPYPMGETLYNEVSGIENFCRYKTGLLIVKNWKEEQTERVSYTDKGFLEMFSFRIIHGDKASAMKDPNNIIISESVALKYFGESDVIGKTIQTNDKDFLVSAVMANAPTNSSIDNNMIINIESIYPDGGNWDNFEVITFVQSEKGKFTSNDFEFNINHVAEKHSEFIKEQLKNYFPEYKGEPIWDINCIPLKDIYHNQVSSFLKSNKAEYSYIMASIAALILLISCINYVLLALAGAESSIKEVGIKKVIGVSKQQLGRQFMGESIILAWISGSMALLLAWYFLPQFCVLTGRKLEFDFVSDFSIILGVFTIVNLVGFIAGAYPSLFLARMAPLKIFRHKSAHRGKGYLTRGLITIQFTICIFFLASSWVMHNQMNFIRTKDLGLKTEKVIQLDIPNNIKTNINTIASRLRTELNDSFQLSAMSSFPWSNATVLPLDNERSVQANWFYIDYNWVDVLGIELKEGRNFDVAVTSDATHAVIINEKLAMELSFDQPVGELLPMGNKDSLRIIGVLKDFHYQSLSQPIAPTYFVISNPYYSELLIRVPSGKNEDFVPLLEKAWKKAEMDIPLNFHYLNDVFTEMYGSEYRWQRIMDISTFIGIAIACLGLFGLIGLEARSRTREIAIRKTLGANTLSIFWLLNNQVARILLYAVIISSPFVIWTMQKWLQSYAYRTTIYWYVIPVAGLWGLLIAFLAVLYPVIKVIKTNPSRYLKAE